MDNDYGMYLSNIKAYFPGFIQDSKTFKTFIPCFVTSFPITIFKIVLTVFNSQLLVVDVPFLGITTILS